MAGRKETPRQKMIGILYLVLLGLVALNVSDSILDAFKNLAVSLSTSTENTQTNIDNMFQSFRASKLKDEPERARPILEKAEEASSLTNELVTYVDELKVLLSSEGGGENENTGDLQRRDNLSISSRIMVNEGRAKKLREKINETSQKLNDLSGNEIDFTLAAVDPPTRGGVQKSWEQANFGDGIPLTAAITALEKVHADAKNAEATVVKQILGQMDVAVVNLDRFAAVAVAPSSYVITGQPYTADVFLTAYDSKSNPSITVNGQALTVADGKGSYVVNTSKEGVYNWVGNIEVKGTDGTVKTYQTAPQTYQVASPSAVVSPDKMLVFYVGVPNPVSVSAPGIPKENLSVSIRGGGSITGSGDKYVANVTQPGSEATVVVSANIGGKSTVLSSTNFRVKRIPDPKAIFAGKSGGDLPVAVLKSQNKVNAVLENFDFDAKFNVQRFTMIVDKPRADALGPFQANSATFTQQMSNAVQGLTPGSRLIISNIVAVGPDGAQRMLDPMVFSAK